MRSTRRHQSLTATAYRNLATITKRAGVGITLHGLRHSQVTLLLDAGVPLQVVSARVGHSETSTTLNIYAHALPTPQRQAAEIVGKLLQKRQTDQGES
jgi:integrase